jgi:hypothetical protein
MIRPSNIDKNNHTADFACDIHGGTVVGANLNTQCPYSEDNSAISVVGSLLTAPCDCASYFPTVGGNQDSQDLAEAKTA